MTWAWWDGSDDTHPETGFRAQCFAFVEASRDTNIYRGGRERNILLIWNLITTTSAWQAGSCKETPQGLLWVVILHTKQ